MTPPVTGLETTSKSAPILFMSADGQLFFEGREGVDALSAIALLPTMDTPITLRADASAEATEVATLLAKLRRMGHSKIDLVGQNK